MEPTSPHGRGAETAALLALALLATFPLFIEIYREMVFHVVPRDDYAPYLLHLLGLGGEAPGAPFAYRILSVVVAIPFFHVLPVYRFSYLRDVDPLYLRASEAIAFVAWLSLAALAVVVYRTARDRLGASRPSAMAALLATPLLARYTQLSGVDAVMMLIVGLAAYAFEKPLAFVALIVVGTGFNEKVPIFASLLVVARVLDARSLRPYRVHLVGCALALLVYALARSHFDVPDNEHQTDPTRFFTSAAAELRATLSSKGLVTNVIPVLTCIAAYLWATRMLRALRSAYFTRVDVLVPLALVAIGFAINVKYTLGRLVMQTMPLFLPAMAAALDRVEAPRQARADTAVRSP